MHYLITHALRKNHAARKSDKMAFKILAVAP